MTGVDAVDEADPGTWTWLLKDAHGSVATHVKADGTVTKQASYDPYGAPDQGGTSGASKSTLGFQSAHTDEVTGNLLLGSRLYDPKVDRFTTSDFFVGSGSDLSLATDPLTGNRYLFAAANPVAFYDDGHAPACTTSGQVCKSYTTRKAVRQRNQQARESASPSPGSFQAADRDAMTMTQPLRPLGITITWADVAAARRQQRLEAQMIEPHPFWNSPFATWHLWEEAEHVAVETAKWSSVGMCLVPGVGWGICAFGAGGSFLAQSGNRAVKGELTVKDTATIALQSAVPLIGGAGGSVAARGMSRFSELGLRAYTNGPSMLCNLECRTP